MKMNLSIQKFDFFPSKFLKLQLFFITNSWIFFYDLKYSNINL